MRRNLFMLTISLFLWQPLSIGATEANAFYAGKIIQMIISTSPGGAPDVVSRLLSPYFGKYLPGHPNIVTQHMAGAGEREGDVRRPARQRQRRALLMLPKPTPSSAAPISGANSPGSVKLINLAGISTAKKILTRASQIARI